MVRWSLDTCSVRLWSQATSFQKEVSLPFSPSVKKWDAAFRSALACLSSVLQCRSYGWPCTRRSSLCWLKHFSLLLEFILPSSARVSLVTYTTVIAVRYPELDNSHDGLTCFGNYLLGTQSTHGGFLPVFWNAPTAYMRAATDIGCVVEWVRSHFTL